MYKCTKCGTEFTLGTKFCQNCGCNLEEEFIQTPTCPKCGKTFPTGTKFCPIDGAKLVSPEKLIPRCVVCAKEYTDGTRFCPEDGGQIIAEAHRNFSAKSGNNSVNKTNDTIGEQIAEVIKQWHGFVIGWAVLALIINVVTLIEPLRYLIIDLKYIGYWDFGNYIKLLLFICPAVIIYGIIKLLLREKSGFTLFVIAATVAAICNIYLHLVVPAVFGLLSIAIWYAVLQIKKNDVSAWNTLK